MKFHYTCGPNADKILADGYIRPTTLHLVPRERGVVWFTTRDTFEPTALPALEETSTGARKNLTLEEAAEIGGGLYRFGLPESHPQHQQVHPWLKICRMAFTPNKVRLSLERTARDMGGNPYTYWGSLSAISIFGCTLEVSKDGSSWEDAMSKEKAAKAGK